MDRVQISCGTVGYFVFKKKPVSQVSCAHYASVSALFFLPYEKWAETLGRKKAVG